MISQNTILSIVKRSIDWSRQQRAGQSGGGDIKTQSELLFGKTFELVSPDGARRPPIHVILIDALDECRNFRDGATTSDERRSLLDFLLTFANSTSWVKVLISSRPVPDIMEASTHTTAAVKRIDINNRKWGASAEIRVLVEVQSEKLKLGLSPNQIDRFLSVISGRYIWWVFRLIQDSKGNKSRLVTDILNGKLPSSKDDPHAPPYLLYQHALNNMVSEGNDRGMMESVLSVIYITATLTKPLSANAISDILYPNSEGEEREENRESVRSIIRSLFSIVYIEEGTEAVRACHLSVLDFIGRMMDEGFPALTTDRGDNAAMHFAIGVQEVHARMFDGCFAIMERDLRFNICELEDSFLLNKDVPNLPARISKHISEALQYADSFWLSHLEQSNIDVKKSTEKVFALLNSKKGLYWIEALSLMDAVERGIVILQDCAGLFTVRPSSREVIQQLIISRVNRASWR